MAYSQLGIKFEATAIGGNSKTNFIPVKYSFKTKDKNGNSIRKHRTRAVAELIFYLTEIELLDTFELFIIFWKADYYKGNKKFLNKFLNELEKKNGQ